MARGVPGSASGATRAGWASRVGDALGRRPTLRLTLAALAVAWFLVQLTLLIGMGQLPFPGGDVTRIFDPAGDRLRAGEAVYLGAFDGGFFYSPPIAILYGAISWLPPAAQQGIVLVGELAALRYLGGSWFGFCCALAFPLMPWELMSGHFNMIIAAGMVLAVRGAPRLAAATAFAKISPALAMDPRDYGKPGVGPQVPLPFHLRAGVALVLLAVFRPWSRCLAAVIAIPAFYYGTFVLLIAPVAVILRGITAAPPRTHPLAALLHSLRGRPGG